MDAVRADEAAKREAAEAASRKKHTDERMQAETDARHQVQEWAQSLETRVDGPIIFTAFSPSWWARETSTSDAHTVPASVTGNFDAEGLRFNFTTNYGGLTVTLDGQYSSIRTLPELGEAIERMRKGRAAGGR